MSGLRFGQPKLSPDEAYEDEMLSMRKTRLEKMM